MVSYHRRNQPCEILSRLVKGLGGYSSPKSGVSHWLWMSLLQQCYALMCYTVMTWSRWLVGLRKQYMTAIQSVSNGTESLVVFNCQTESNNRFFPWIGTLYWDYCNVVFTLASIVGQKHHGMWTHHNCHLLAWLLDHYVCLQKLEIRCWVSDICQTVIGWMQFMCLVIETYCVICINQREFAVDQSTLVILWFDWLTFVLSIFVTT